MADCYQVRVAIYREVPTYQKVCGQQYTASVKSCIATQTTKYKACTQTAQQSYSQCSGFWKWLCVAWTWVSFVVCVAYAWLESTVCIAWAFLKVIICLFYLVFVIWVRVFVAWAIYYICRLPEIFTNLWLNLRNEIAVRLYCANPSDMPPNPIEKAGWHLTFSDEFPVGTSAINTSYWEDHPWFVKRYYTDKLAQGTLPWDYFDPGQFNFGSGTLLIRTDNNPIKVNDAIYPYGNPPGTFTIDYRSGWIEWIEQLDQRHGYFEIRCKVPGTPNMWPSFWMAARKHWPPEIDIFEFSTDDTSHFKTTQHWGTKDDAQQQARTHSVCKASEYFHIYACEWTEEKIYWYCDNRLIRVATDGLSEFLYTMLVIAGCGVNKNSGHYPELSSYPNYYEIDYVRAYSR